MYDRNYYAQVDDAMMKLWKRHVVGGVLMSVSLFFGGLAFTLMTVKGEPDEERNA